MARTIQEPRSNVSILLAEDGGAIGEGELEVGQNITTPSLVGGRHACVVTRIDEKDPHRAFGENEQTIFFLEFTRKSIGYRFRNDEELRPYAESVEVDVDQWTCSNIVMKSVLEKMKFEGEIEG